MILYSFPNTCALASHIALEFTGADYEVRSVDFRTDGQKSPDYLRINPKARVPALVTESGTLTETPAILAYIAQSFPDAKLAPTDPWGFAQVQAFNSYMCSTVHVAHAHKYRGYRWATEQSSFDDMKQFVPTSMGQCFALIENEMLKGPWVHGDDFSISDIYLLTIARWLEADEVDLTPLPRVIDHRNRMLSLPEVQRVLEAE